MKEQCFNAPKGGIAVLTVRLSEPFDANEIEFQCPEGRHCCFNCIRDDCRNCRFIGFNAPKGGIAVLTASPGGIITLFCQITPTAAEFSSRED